MEMDLEAQNDINLRKDYEKNQDLNTYTTAAVPATDLKADELGGIFNEDDYVDVPPDGGYGWFCCAYITAMNFSTWGVNCGFGIFLSFYLENDVFPGATPTDYALVGGLVVFFTLALIPYSAILLLKFGYKVTAGIGIIIQLAGFMGASFAETVAQFYITQGVLVGISYGIIFGANSVVLPSWFLKKRALANGISHAGVGFGGVVFTLIINKMIQETGDQKWALRAIGIISFVICTVTMFLIKIRVPQNSQFKDQANPSIKIIMKSIFDYKIWKSFPLQLATLWSCIATTGYCILLYSLSNYAISMGYSTHQAMVVTVVFNAVQSLGRPLIGYLSETCGRVNLTMFATFYTCVMCLCFWINLKNYASLIVFTILSGVFVGISSVNVVPLVADVVGLNNFASGLGFANFWNAVMSLIAETIALNLRDYNLVNRNPYFHCQIFVGVLYFAALIALIPYRQWKVKRMIYQLKDSKSLSEEERVELREMYDNDGIKAYFQRAFHRANL